MYYPPTAHFSKRSRLFFCSLPCMASMQASSEESELGSDGEGHVPPVDPNTQLSQLLLDILKGIKHQQMAEGVVAGPEQSSAPCSLARSSLIEWLDEVERDSFTGREAEKAFIDLLLESDEDIAFKEELGRLRKLHIDLASLYGFAIANSIMRAHGDCNLSTDCTQSSEILKFVGLLRAAGRAQSKNVGRRRRGGGNGNGPAARNGNAPKARKRKGAPKASPPPPAPSPALSPKVQPAKRKRSPPSGRKTRSATSAQTARKKSKGAGGQ